LKIKRNLLISEATPWGGVEVYQSDSVRDLYIKDKAAIQSQLDMAQKEKLLLQYSRAMMSFLLFQPRPKSILLLGLGGGSIIHFLSHWFPKLKITAVDVNYKIIDIAKKYFSIIETPKIGIKKSDALIYLTQDRNNYFNVILVDIHDGSGMPDFIFSNDFMAQCFRTLSDRGILVINLLASNDQSFINVMTALRESFTGISLCMTLKQQKNILLFAFKSIDIVDMKKLHIEADKLENKYDIEFSQFVNNIIKVDAKY